MKSDADLETLALISAEASRHLQRLDPDKLSPETGKKVALAIRQMAQVSQFQGKLAEALEGFQRSRDLLSHLNNKYRGMPSSTSGICIMNRATMAMHCRRCKIIIA